MRSYYAPTITQDERDKFAGLRSSSDPPAVERQWGRWGDNIPQREGFDQNVRTVWICNLFYCS